MKKQYTNWEAFKLAIETPGRVFLDSTGVRIRVAQNGTVQRAAHVDRDNWYLHGDSFNAASAPFTDPNEPDEIELSEEYRKAYEKCWGQMEPGYEAIEKARAREFIRLVKLELKK